jgi:chaperonin GroEL
MFSLFTGLYTNIQTIEKIYNCIKMSFGPTGKKGLVFTKKNELKFLSSGFLLIKELSFHEKVANLLLKLLEQAAIKTQKVSGDGSSTSLLLSCGLLTISLRFLANGYNSIQISKGLKKIAHFFREKIFEFAVPVSNISQITDILQTAVGKKLDSELFSLLSKSLLTIDRDGLILVEENNLIKNELEYVKGIELDRGFASSYFVNDLKNFQVVYENPYILIANDPIKSMNQLNKVLDYVKQNNRSLIIIAEEINKDILSTLILNNIKKKLKIAVIKFSSINFIKNGILEDLALLTHSNSFEFVAKKTYNDLIINDLGQAEKVIITKDKSTFLFSKFSKIITKRRINELNRELLMCETDYEKSIFKNRIARLSGSITKIKIVASNQYQINFERQKIENLIFLIKSSLEEGILPGGGIFYLFLRDELQHWGYLNLIGEEIFSMQIAMEALLLPFIELFNNSGILKYEIFQKLSFLGYPYGYDLTKQKIVNTFKEGLIDSSKMVRSILWNSFTLVSTIITNE